MIPLEPRRSNAAGPIWTHSLGRNARHSLASGKWNSINAALYRAYNLLRRWQTTYSHQPVPWAPIQRASDSTRFLFTGTPFMGISPALVSGFSLPLSPQNHSPFLHQLWFVGRRGDSVNPQPPTQTTSARHGVIYISKSGSRPKGNQTINCCCCCCYF